MKKSLDEIIQKIELEKNSKKIQERLTDDEVFQQRERQRLQYLKDCKMYESLAQSNAPSSAAAGGSTLYVDSWISYFNRTLVGCIHHGFWWLLRCELAYWYVRNRPANNDGWNIYTDIIEKSVKSSTNAGESPVFG